MSRKLDPATARLLIESEPVTAPGKFVDVRDTGGDLWPAHGWNDAWARLRDGAREAADALAGLGKVLHAVDWARRYPRPSRGYARHVRRMKQTERRHG